LHKILHGPLETWYRNYIQVTSLSLPPHKSNFVIECRNDIFAQQWLIWCTHWEETHSNTIHDVELDLLYSLHTSSFVTGELFKFEVRERLVVWMSEITNYGGGVNWLQVSRLLSKRANIRGTEGLMNAEWTYKRKLCTNTECERANKSSFTRPVCFAASEAERLRLRYHSQWGTDGSGEWGWGFKSPPPRNSYVLTKLSRIPSSVENTSVTT
jgi:hypothetical protein